MSAAMDTSTEARPDKSAAEILREKVYLAICRCRDGCTTHEVAAILAKPVPSVQPRVSELKAAGKIVDTGVRRMNAVSGKRAAVFAVPARPAKPVQLNLFATEGLRA